MNSHSYFIIFVVIWFLIKSFFKKMDDPFRYIWDMEALNERWRIESAKKTACLGSLAEMHSKAANRIKEDLPRIEANLSRFLEEVAYTLSRKRSLERLLDMTWEYARNLAHLSGYSRDEVEKEGFFCPGWTELWRIYYENKSRILRKNNEKPPYSSKNANSNKAFLDRKKHLFQISISHLKEAQTKDRLTDEYARCVRVFKAFGTENHWEFSGSIEELALRDLFEILRNSFPKYDDDYDDDYESYYESECFGSNGEYDNKYESQQEKRESIKEKNERIFEGIWEISELKKKYYRLAKLNHPDHGGSERAMKLLNQYYFEALERIQSHEASSY